MIKVVHRYERGTQIKIQKWFWKILLQADEQFSVRKDYEECTEAQRHQTWNNL